MAPLKRAEVEKIPKQVELARAALNGKEVTADNLKAAMSSKDLNNLASSFRNSMTPAVKDEYKQLKSDSDRRAWLAQYVVDPKQATTTGFNRTTAVNEQMKEGAGQWLHESEIGGPRFLNDPEAARILCESGELESRPSEYESLAKVGKKQHYFNWELFRKKTGFRDEAGVEAQADLKPDEYSDIKKHMTESFGKSVVKKRPPTKEPKSEEKKRRREVSNSRGVFVRKLKSLVDKATNEVSALERDLTKLAERGYPEAMQLWCKQKLESMTADIKQANDTYLRELAKTISNQTTEAELSASNTILDNAIQTLEKCFADWKKTGGQEVRKLIG